MLGSAQLEPAVLLHNGLINPFITRLSMDPSAGVQEEHQTESGKVHRANPPRSILILIELARPDSSTIRQTPFPHQPRAAIVLKATLRCLAIQGHIDDSLHA